MDNPTPEKFTAPVTLESEFQREEAELRTWLNENVSDKAARKWYLARMREDHISRGRQHVWID